MAEKVLAAHQPNFLPWGGYFIKMLYSDVFVILDDVQLSRPSYTTRTQINRQGQGKWLSVSIANKGHMDKKISDIELSDSFDAEVLIRKIEQTYKSCPFFEEVHDGLTKIFRESHKTLLGLNMALLEWARDWLHIKTPLVFSSSCDVPAGRTDRLVELCVSQDATVYLSGAGGKNYNEQEMFQERGIDVCYTKVPFFDLEYLSQTFVAGCSIVDLLFHTGHDSQKILMSGVVDE